MKPTLSDKVMISPEVLFQEVGGEAVLLDLAGGSYFGLDEVGTRVWQLLQEHSRLRTLYEVMLMEFDVEPTRLEEDLLRLLGELADARLVIVNADVATPP
jgi:hypothetical protein